MAPKTVQFVGLSGYAYPHTRVRCYHFAGELAKYGYKTRVLSFHDRLAPDLPEAEMYGLPDHRRLALIVRGATRLLPYRGSLLYIQKIHYHALAPLLVSRITGRPYVLDYDDYEVRNDPYGVPLFCGFKSPRITKLLFGTENAEEILANTVQGAQFTVAASHFLFEQLRRLNERVVYIPTGVDVTLFRPRPEEHQDHVVLLWNGVVWGEAIRDNLLFLLDVLEAVVARKQNVLLRSVGGGPFMDEVRRAAQRKRLDRFAEFRDWVSPDEMPRELASADIGLLPLAHSDSWTRGKSPTKLFEYMAAGLAVVVSGKGEAARVIEHGVDGFVADDRTSFTKGVLALVDSVAMRNQLGRAARRKAEERYSLPVLGRGLASALERFC